MCTPDQPCKCFHAGAEDIVDSVLAWANGDHGTACRCDSCGLALMLMARGLPGLGQLVWSAIREPQATPPPSDTMDAGTGEDF